MDDHDDILPKVVVGRKSTVTSIVNLRFVAQISTHILMNNFVKNHTIIIILVYIILKKCDASVYKIVHHTFKMSPHYFVKST